ncbi:MULTISPECIES: DUF2752 domain-containing protein [unclassified Streptomyces]|uniref:DUF2752 domain-containing protein n=1 Tax=unclassified Streptomyces TaxID=2593676 RepID=UPI003828C985
MSPTEPALPDRPAAPGFPAPDTPAVRAPESIRRRTALTASAVLGAGALGAVYLWNTNPHEPGQLLPGCPLRWATGLLCPVCGGTRMAYDLMHADVVTAFHDNALLLTLGLPVAGYFLLRKLIAGLRGRVYRPRLTARGNAVMLSIAAVWMIGRNLVG